MAGFFGRMAPAPEFENAAIETLKFWGETYFREVERQQNLDINFLQPIASWATKSRFEQIAGDEWMPMVAVVSPGTQGNIHKDGRGVYRVEWPLHVAVLVSAPYSPDDLDGPRQLAGYYAAAIRTALIQKKLHDIEAHLDWTGERYDDLPVASDRSLATARIQFNMGAYDVATAKDGPPEPDPDPGDVPVIEDHEITVHPQPNEED